MKSVWMRILGVLLIVLGVIFTLMAVMLFIGSENDKKAQSIIFLAISAAFWTFGIRLVRKAKKQRIEQLKKLTNFIVCHEQGLPLAQNATCEVIFCDDEVQIKAFNSLYRIQFSKIKDITIKPDYEVRQEYVSSAGGAIAGGMMFGALGAMVGGRPKKKTVYQRFDHYLVIVYEKDNSNFAQVAFKLLDIKMMYRVISVREILAQRAPVHMDL